ncbi:MAG: putative quinol monooxygenase [Pseudomonadota bacterium]
MFAVVVTFRTLPGKMPEFLPLMLANAAESRDEPGCQRFDVCTDPSEPDEVFLYEIYDDQAAFAVHMTTSHFLDFDGKTTHMIAEKKVRTYGAVDA